MKKISIVIPVFRGVNVKLTEECVASLRRNSKEHHEIIIVINPGTDVEAYKHIDADLVVGIEDQGQCHANNFGVSKAKNEWVMIADNDNVFPADWEKALDHLKPDLVLTLNWMENNPRGVAPGVIFCDCGGIDNFDREKYEVEAKKASREEFMPGFGYPFIFEKKHYEVVGGFDIAYDPLGNTCDSDFRYRLMLYGLDMQRYFGVVCYHFCQMIAWTFYDDAKCDYHLKGNRRIFETKFNAAQAPSPQIWYSEFFIDETKLRFKADWIGKISRRWIGSEDLNKYFECSECRYHFFVTREKCPRCGHPRPESK